MTGGGGGEGPLYWPGGPRYRMPDLSQRGWVPSPLLCPDTPFRINIAQSHFLEQWLNPMKGDLQLGLALCLKPGLLVLQHWGTGGPGDLASENSPEEGLPILAGSRRAGRHVSCQGPSPVP